MDEINTFSVNLELLENYVFKIDFDQYGYILSDEPPPLGEGEGPNPARLIGAAVGNCLCASLLFALRKKKQNVPSIKAEVSGEITRVDGFWRITQLNVAIDAQTTALDPAILDAAIQQFENFCLVTQSIRRGIPIHVELKNENGELLLSSD